MALEHADRHIRALLLAKACVELGARIKTVTKITGLRASLLREYFYNNISSTSGRWPESCEWYHMGSTVDKAEASLFATIFATLEQDHRCLPGEALVGAYRMYKERCIGTPRISFERAFQLACDLKGIWDRSCPQLALHTCPLCRSRFLVSLGDRSADRRGCVFCRLLRKYPTDMRIFNHFVARPPGALAPEQEVLLADLRNALETADKNP